MTVILPAVILLFTAACNLDNTSVKRPEWTLALRQLNLHDNTIRLKIPASWTHQRKTYMWDPDCASCSGSEYAYVFGTADSSSFVSVGVKVYPAADNRFDSAKRGLSVISEKDLRASLIDTLIDVKAQTRTIYWKSWRCQRVIYSASKDFVSRYRTISIYVQVPETAENMTAMKEIIESVTVDKVYLAAPYK